MRTAPSNSMQPVLAIKCPMSHAVKGQFFFLKWFFWDWIRQANWEQFPRRLKGFLVFLVGVGNDVKLLLQMVKHDWRNSIFRLWYRPIITSAIADFLKSKKSKIMLQPGFEHGTFRIHFESSTTELLQLSDNRILNSSCHFPVWNPGCSIIFLFLHFKKSAITLYIIYSFWELLTTIHIKSISPFGKIICID